MNISTRQMRAFLAVMRTGSFTRAAEHSHMTQAGLSLLIRELETQLGARLFDRTTRSVQPTAAGRRLAPVVERALLELDNVTDDIGAQGLAARRHLRIAATPLVSSHLLPQLLAGFAREHPDTRVTLIDSSLSDVEAAVAAGEADLGLGFFFQRTPGLLRVPIGRFALMRVTPADDLAQGAGRAPWSALAGQPRIGLPPDNPIQKTIDAQLARLGIGQADSQAVHFFGTLIAMVEAGFGTAIMPTFALSACRRYRVRADVLTHPRVSLGFYRISKRGAGETPAMSAFTQRMVAELPSMSQ